MARGWESKAIESQMEDRAQAAHQAHAPEMSLEERQRYIRRESLQLQRTRVLAELQASCNPRFRGQLESELAWLDTEIAGLAGPH